MNEVEKENAGVLSQDLILLDHPATSQAEILSLLAESAKQLQYIKDEETFLHSVLQREEEVSTAIGYLIAIPHGKTDVVEKPFIGFARLQKEIQWGENSDEPVRLVFLIGVPETSAGTLHLRFISQLSRKLLDETFREKLLSLTDKEAVYQHLQSIDIN